MKTARKELSLFDKGASALRTSIMGLGSVLAASFTVGSLRRTIGDLEDLADAADRLGTTAQRLGGLEHAGFMADVSSGTLIRSLTFLEKNVGKNADTFASLGLSVERLKHMDAVSMFIEVAEAINKMPTPAERTAAAMSLFGKSGAQLMELISGGKAGIQGAMEEAGIMGLVPDEAEIEQIKKAEEALKGLGQAFEAVKRQAAIEAARVLGEFMPANKARQPLAKAVETFTPDQMKKFGAIAEMTNGIRAFQAFTRTFREEFGDMSAEDLAQVFNPLLAAVKNRQKREQSQFGESLNRMDSVFKEMTAPKTPSAPFLGFHELLMPGFLKDIEKRRVEFDNALTKADEHFIENRIDEQTAGLSGHAAARSRRRSEFSLPGNAALEQGSAAAFSQEKRSQQQNQQLDVSRKILKQAEKQNEALKKIDASIKATESTIPANFA